MIRSWVTVAAWGLALLWSELATGQRSLELVLAEQAQNDAENY